MLLPLDKRILSTNPTKSGCKLMLNAIGKDLNAGIVICQPNKHFDNSNSLVYYLK